MQRRDFLRSVIVGTLAAPFVTRQVKALSPAEIHDANYNTHQFYPPLDGPIRGSADFAGHRFVFTERSVYDVGPITANTPVIAWKDPQTGQYSSNPLIPARAWQSL